MCGISYNLSSFNNASHCDDQDPLFPAYNTYFMELLATAKINIPYIKATDNAIKRICKFGKSFALPTTCSYLHWWSESRNTGTALQYFHYPAMGSFQEILEAQCHWMCFAFFIIGPLFVLLLYGKSLYFTMTEGLWIQSYGLEYQRQ